MRNTEILPTFLLLLLLWFFVLFLTNFNIYIYIRRKQFHLLQNKLINCVSVGVGRGRWVGALFCTELKRSVRSTEAFRLLTLKIDCVVNSDL